MLRKWGTSYGVALAAVAVAVLVRWLLDPWLGDYLPLATLYGAVAFAVYATGPRPALLITAIGYLACNWLFFAPKQQFSFRPEAYAGILAYLISCVAIIALGEAMRRARFRAVALNDSLKQEVTNRREAEAEIRREIEQRKRNEITLHELTQQWKIITDSMSAAVTRCSRDLRYLWVSKPIANFLGRNVEEIVGRPIVEILGQAAFDQLLPYFERVLTGEVVRFEEQVKYQGIGTRWITATYTPTFDEHGKCDGWVAHVEDLTERKKAEQRINEDLEAMTLLQEIGNLCAAKDTVFQRCLTRIFEIAIAFTGAQKGTLQLFDDKTNTLRIITQIGFEEPFLRFFETVNTEDAAVCGEAMRSNGRVVVYDVLQSEIFAGQPSLDVLLRAGVRAVQSTPLISSAGTLIGMISTHYSSPQRPSERQLRFMDLLARQAADYLDRNRAENLLREYVQQLAEADRRKDEFLASLAHELRNPLAPITNALQVLTEVGSPDPEFVWSRDLIQRQVEHMVRLLDDLLDVRRITSNKIDLKKTRITLASVVQSAIETSRSHIDDARHELIVSLPAEPAYIEGDPVRLAQVFSNLLNNAAKFTREGGRIWLSAERRDDEISVSVKDSGIGIKTEMLPRLFEIFSQVEPLYERSHEGLGIGLWLAKSLIELHGGSITALSDGTGKGSEFIARLPVITSSVIADPGRPGEDNESQQGKNCYRILVVDDRKNAADILARLLRKRGHEVHTANDGQDALLAAEKLRPQVVLLDIGMPGMNGHEVCRQIRSQPWGEEMYLIAVSGWGQEQDKRRSAEAGFDDHLVKPVHSSTLVKALDSIGAPSRVNAGFSPIASM